MTTTIATYTAFDGAKQIAAGTLIDITLFAKDLLTRNESTDLLVFDDFTGKVIDLDTRGSEKDIRKRLAAMQAPQAEEAKKSGPGRPKLGVVSREIALLPRHWEWLATQSGGASVTLRKLVDDARKKNQGRDQLRAAQESAYRFMQTMAGDRIGFEEALRALYAKNLTQFKKMIVDWPKDIRNHVLKLSKPAFEQEADT
jgi:hypothetical protein